ncbi:MAG TPA: hypothetical protein VK635_21105 [Bradyrhizobium sp.]|jgi:hypothetical protein|nr:hypothetical protein [Bradyrhizobium sp.]
MLAPTSPDITKAQLPAIPFIAWIKVAIVRLRFFARRVATPVLPADLLRARFVARLFLSALVAHDALIIAPGWTRFGFRHALLAAMFAALILRTLQIVFFRHRDQILFSRFRARPLTINAIPRRRVPPAEDAEDKENPPREPRKAGSVGGSLGSGNFQPISLRSRQRSLAPQI